MDDMLDSVVKTIADMGKIQENLRLGIKVESLHDEGEALQKIVRYGDKTEILTLPKTPLGRRWILHTVPSVVGYLNSNHAAAGGIVMVNMDGTVVNLAIDKHVPHTVFMGHRHATEFGHLMQTFRPLGQRAMRMMLREKLGANIKHAETIQNGLAGIDIAVSKKTELNDLNIKEVDKTTTVIQFNYLANEGTKPAQLLRDTVYTGRIFDCVDKQYEIPLVLSVDEQDGKLVFAFSAPLLDDTIAKAVADIAEMLRGNVSNDQIQIYEGSFNG